MKHRISLVMVVLAAIALMAAPIMACDGSDCEVVDNQGFIWTNPTQYHGNYSEVFCPNNVVTTFESSQSHQAKGQYISGDFNGTAIMDTQQFSIYDRVFNDPYDGSTNHWGQDYQQMDTSGGLDSTCPNMSIDAQHSVHGVTDTNYDGDVSGGYMTASQDLCASLNARTEGIDPKVNSYLESIHGYYTQHGGGNNLGWQGGSTAVTIKSGNPSLP